MGMQGQGWRGAACSRIGAVAQLVAGQGLGFGSRVMDSSGPALHPICLHCETVV